MTMDERYKRAVHRVQTAIGALMGLNPNLQRVQPKHMRVGIDLSKADQVGLARLLIDKGVFTMEEYLEAITAATEQEAKEYEQEVQEAFDNPHIRVN